MRLGIASGRLRQGETYLLDTAANTFDGFFLTAADSTETDSLASFGRVLASYSGGGRYAFADWDGTAAAVRVVGEGLRRGQIQVDVAIFAPDEPGRPRRVLSLGEAKWDKVMSPTISSGCAGPATCSP